MHESVWACDTHVAPTTDGWVAGTGPGPGTNHHYALAAGGCRRLKNHEELNPATAEVTASVELASVAERATTTKPEASGPHTGGKAEHEVCVV